VGARGKARGRGQRTNGEDVLLLRHEEAEAAAGRVLVRDARGLVAEDALNVGPGVELVREALWDGDSTGRVAILDDDQVVGLEEGPPHLEEVEVADGGDDNVLRGGEAGMHACRCSEAAEQADMAGSPYAPSSSGLDGKGRLAAG
jgi:hypothetical protein